MTLVALVLGYLAGGIPTADWLAAAKDVDLRSDGSGNPGANNARRVGGTVLGAAVLLAEVAKGVAIVTICRAFDPDLVPVVAVAAVAGNVANPYRRFVGGQGLGITLGVLAAAWPTVLPLILVVIAGVATVLKRAPAATIAAVTVLVTAAFVWERSGLPTAWGASPDGLPWLGTGLALVILPKQVRHLIADRRDRSPEN